MKEKGQLQISCHRFLVFLLFILLFFHQSLREMARDSRKFLVTFLFLFCSFCSHPYFIFTTRRIVPKIVTRYIKQALSALSKMKTVWNFFVTIFFLFLLLLPEIFCRKLARDCCEFLVTIFFCFLLLFLFFISSSFTWSLPRAG